jgi:hypothetical protein
MDATKLQLKIFATPESAKAVHAEAFVPVFHRWIKEHVLPELLIDVASYVHVPEGPSVALIGHGSDYFLDEGAGRLGLLYSRKRAGFAPDERLGDLARRTFHAATLLEAASPPGSGPLRFATGELLLRINDRLAAPATDATFAAVRPEVEAFAAKLYGPGAFELTRVGTPKDLFALRIVSTPGATNVPLATLLERAGGPPAKDASLP